MSTAYSSGIFIKGGRRDGDITGSLSKKKATDFVNTTKECLDSIKKTKTGMQLINEINASGKVVNIYRVWDIDEGNCQGGGDDAKAMVIPLSEIHGDDTTELHRVLSLACRDTSNRSKWNRFFSIGKPKPYFPGGRDGIARFVGIATSDLKAMEFGKKPIDKRVDSKLRVYLYDFLTPGDGDSCYVEFNHKVDNLSDSHKKYLPVSHNWEHRPPAVALAHELIHAWRVVKGLVLFDYGWEEEAMTVGLPPFNMQLTENRIRVEWGGLSIRQHYEGLDFESDMFDASSKIGIDPDSKTWKGKHGALHPDQFLAQQMSKRRKAMGYEGDEDGF